MASNEPKFESSESGALDFQLATRHWSFVTTTVETWDCAIVGGGAAGFFAAVTCAETNPALKVTLFEAAARPLVKVAISGGGRCNVTHSCFEPRELVKYYPRGARELLGPFHAWQPRDTMAWFTERGVELKTEADGRVFPANDLSTTITDCLYRAAERTGVRLRTSAGVKQVERAGEGALGFLGTLATGEAFTARRILLATGGGRGSAGLTVAESLGHTIEPVVPSLFTFHIDDARVKGLEGLSVPDAQVSVKDESLAATGPVLITHWGMSGPGILKLSAWGARELAARDYRFTLRISWVGKVTTEAAEAELNAARVAQAKRKLSSWNPFGLPGRLWDRLTAAAGVGEDQVWASLSRVAGRALAGQLTAGEFAVSGKSPNKEEFVSCGGVRLSEVDFRTMESKLTPGLFLAGEVLDIDGLTGGFNLQSAWTTGRLAGLAMARA